MVSAQSENLRYFDVLVSDEDIIYNTTRDIKLELRIVIKRY